MKCVTRYTSRVTLYTPGDAVVFGRSIINQMEDIRSSLGDDDDDDNDDDDDDCNDEVT